MTNTLFNPYPYAYCFNPPICLHYPRYSVIPFGIPQTVMNPIFHRNLVNSTIIPHYPGFFVLHFWDDINNHPSLLAPLSPTFCHYVPGSIILISLIFYQQQHIFFPNSQNRSTPNYFNFNFTPIPRQAFIIPVSHPICTPHSQNFPQIFGFSTY